MLPAVFFLFVPLVAAEIQSLEVTVLRYQALKYSEIENLEHLYYSFEFCLCNKSFSGLFPNTSPLCECTSPQRGKRAIESIPKAIFPSSCLYTYSSRCLSVRFTGEDFNKELYVKVMIGKNILTYPSWQQLAMSQYKIVSGLRTTAGNSIRIMYVASLKNEQLSNENNVPTATWKKTQPVAAESPQSASLNAELFSLLRQHFSHAVVKGQIARRSSATAAPTTKAMITTTTSRRTTTTSTTTPSPSRKIVSDSDTSDVQHIRNVFDVKMFMLKRSISDRREPRKYNVEHVKDKICHYHNVYRNKHGAPPVQRDTRLDSAAQRWANRLGKDMSCLVHEQPRIYGENLFVFGANQFPDETVFAKAAIQSFYMEGYGYNYNGFKPLSFYKTGHFTQLIWRDSRRIGVGISIVRSDGTGRGVCHPPKNAYMIYVCVKYDPPGNFQTKKAYIENVRPER